MTTYESIAKLHSKMNKDSTLNDVAVFSYLCDKISKGDTSDKNKCVEEDGHKWMKLSPTDMASEMKFLNVNQIRYAISRLARYGLVHKASKLASTKGSMFDHSLWYAVQSLASIVSE